MTSSLAHLLASGGSAVGSWCATPAPFTVELLTTDDVDFVVLDCQHGLLDRASLPGLLPAVRDGVTALVRVSANDPAEIGRALDLGADGVIVPMVDTPEEAARAVAACRYPPRGSRSYGPSRAGLRLGTDPAVLEAHPLCFVMLETPTAVAAASGICAVDGVSGAYIGPADLAIGLGVNPSDMARSPAHAEAVEAVRTACATEARFPAIHSTGGADAAARLAAGFRLVSLPTDAVLLRSALQRELSTARGGDAAPSAALRPYG